MKLICEPACEPHRKIALKDGAWPLINSILLIVMPKCAMCWAAYLSLFSFMGLSINYQPWFLPFMICLFLVSIARLIYKAIKTKNFVTLFISLMASTVIICQKLWWESNVSSIIAITILISAMLMEALHNKRPLQSSNSH